MAWQGKHDVAPVTAQNDLRNVDPGTGMIFKAIGWASGDIASVGSGAAGAATANALLVVGAANAQTARARSQGVGQVTAGDVIVIGRTLTLNTSGHWIDADSGDRICGRALEASAAGNSGSTFAAEFDLSGFNLAVDCLHMIT